MRDVFRALYHSFCTPCEAETLRREFAEYHAMLNEALTAEQKTLLLRLIDTTEQITELQSIDSFMRGFQLAWQLGTELEHYAKAHPIMGKP